jgi:hypothetical protein
MIIPTMTAGEAKRGLDGTDLSQIEKRTKRKHTNICITDAFFEDSSMLGGSVIQLGGYGEA